MFFSFVCPVVLLSDAEAKSNVLLIIVRGLNLFHFPHVIRFLEKYYNPGYFKRN